MLNKGVCSFVPNFLSIHVHKVKNNCVGQVDDERFFTFYVWRPLATHLLLCITYYYYYYYYYYYSLLLLLLLVK